MPFSHRYEYEKWSQSIFEISTFYYHNAIAQRFEDQKLMVLFFAQKTHLENGNVRKNCAGTKSNSFSKKWDKM